MPPDYRLLMDILSHLGCLLCHVNRSCSPSTVRFGETRGDRRLANSPFHGVHMLSEQEIRARFPICMLKLDDEQLRIVERFAQLKLYKDGVTIVAMGIRAPIYHVSGMGTVV